MSKPPPITRSTRPRSSPRTGARGTIISSRNGSRPGSSCGAPRSRRCAPAKGSIAESYALVEGEEVWLINRSIPEYSHGNRMNHEPRRRRRLLLRGREIAKLQGAVTRQGLTLVPLSIYFNAAGGPRSSWRWPGARRSTTSARRSRSATGSASRAG